MTASSVVGNMAGVAELEARSVSVGKRKGDGNDIEYRTTSGGRTDYKGRKSGAE